jgi:hydroxymethylbilane synthase
VSKRRPLRLGTRPSRLARWQAEWVRRELLSRGQPAELVEISTTGDEAPETALSRLEGSDLFTRQIDQALLEARVDLAVHSLKDLPTTLPDGIRIAAVTPREDPRDALIGRAPLQWNELPEAGVVATCSLRRRAQLLRSRPDLTVTDIRGNIETRLAKLDANPEWSATILAVAGLARLGLTARIGERLEPGLMLPAPGQGALAVTVRADDRQTARIAHESVRHPETACCVTAERALLHHLDSGCHAPVAALAVARGPHQLELAGRVLSLDGQECVEASLIAPALSESEAAGLGIALADRLLSMGAEQLLGGLRAREVQ